MTPSLVTPPATVQHFLAEMTWPEIEQKRRHSPLAIIPTGACEQHGHHMTMETDARRATQFASNVADRLGSQAVITPTLNIGVSAHHMAFPGTLTLNPVTFQQILYEVVESLYRHGWRAVFILNGHGGNNSATGVAVGRLQSEFPDLHIAWSGMAALASDLNHKFVVGPKAAHASEIETSQALFLAPDVVREGILKLQAAESPVRYAGTPALAGVMAPRPFHLVSPDGATGTPSASTREIGEELMTTAADRLAGYLGRFIDAAQAGEAARTSEPAVKSAPVGVAS